MRALWRLQNQARYLVSLVDAVDELLGRWVPQEVHGGGIHSLCLHVLGGCGGHCSHMKVEGSSTNVRRPHGEKRQKGNPSHHSGLKSNHGADGREASVSQANLCVATKNSGPFLWESCFPKAEAGAVLDHVPSHRSETDNTLNLSLSFPQLPLLPPQINPAKNLEWPSASDCVLRSPSIFQFAFIVHLADLGRGKLNRRTT